MKRISTYLILVLTASTSFGQIQLNYAETIKSITNSKTYQEYLKTKKINQNNKALSFEKAYSTLEYDTTNSVWDSISRTTEYLDGLPASPTKVMFSQLTESYNGQFYIRSDSSVGVIDTSYNSYKVPTDIGVFDTIRTFSYDSASAAWIPFIENYVTVNANNDITKHETFLNLAAFGLPGGMTPFGRYDFSYNASNQLTHWVEKEMQFGVGLIKADSVNVSVNANGNRTVDETYEWNGVSWDLAEKMLYSYDANNNLTEEILQTYNQGTSNFENTNKNSYTYNASGDILTDTAFTHPGSWTVDRIEVRTYTSFGDDLSRSDFAVSNGNPYLFSIKDYFHNSSNNRDSVVERNRQTHSTAAPLRLFEKEVYRSSPFPAGGGTGTSIPSAPNGLMVLAGQKSVIPVMDLTWTDNSNNEIGFAIERSIDSLNWIIIDSTAINIAAYQDTSIVANQKYYYRVLAFNSNGSSAYSNGASGTSLAVGIAELKQVKFDVYPNPSNGKITIQNSGEPSFIKVYSMSGKLIQERLIQTELIIELYTGIYFLMINNQVSKVVIQ